MWNADTAKVAETKKDDLHLESRLYNQILDFKDKYSLLFPTDFRGICGGGKDKY